MIVRVSDASLALMVLDGNHAAFAELARRHSDVLGWMCTKYFIPGADDDDLHQEALVGLHRACMSYHAGRGARFRSFASLVIERHIQTQVRLSRSMKRLAALDAISLDAPVADSTGTPMVQLLADDRLDVHATIEAREQVDSLVRIAGTMSPLERTALARRLDGAAYEDVAADLGTSRKAVDNALQRVRRKLVDAAVVGSAA